ncbi:hypothetical protein E2C01_092202 [Portunus trituberculatus]|uniref:Uncharacterized protein n=1 Tax=Portunus trituberculatus TaxID=210409 RepID=A0A5B7JFX2_PORTR|nr:hypothetical protein [Portunus trituberculatus]
MGGSAGCLGQGTSSPCGPIVEKKVPHDAECLSTAPLPKHPSLDTQPSSTGRPLLGDPSSGWFRLSTGCLRKNHLVWFLTGDLTSMGSPLSLERAEQGPKPPSA